MATQGNRESGRSREAGASSRPPDQVRDLINVFGDAIAGSEERQSRVPGGSGHHAYLEIKQISEDNMKSQKECAGLFLAASKLKHEISFLSDALEIFRSFFELQKCLPVWEVTDRSHFKQLGDAIESVHQAARDLNSSEVTNPPDFLIELYFTCKSVSKDLKYWTKPSRLARHGGHVLGLGLKDSDPPYRKIKKDADKAQLTLILKEISERLEEWTENKEQNMKGCLNEARIQWRIKGEEGIREMLGDVIP